MGPLKLVVLLCVLATFVHCDEDVNKPKRSLTDGNIYNGKDILSQAGLENIYSQLYGGQYGGGVNLANAYGVNLNSAGLQLNNAALQPNNAGLQPNNVGLQLNHRGLNLNQAGLNQNQAGLILNQGGYLLNQQPQNTGSNAAYLNLIQQPQKAIASSGLNLFNGGYSTLNLQPTNNGASYAGAYGNAYSGLSGTDMASFIDKAVKNYNQQQAGTGSDMNSQTGTLGAHTTGNYLPVQTLKSQGSSIETSPGSNLFHPQSLGTGNSQISVLQLPNYQLKGANFVSQDVSQGSNLYNPQSVSLQGFQHQFNQQQGAVPFAGVNGIQHQPAPVSESQPNNVQLIPTGQQTQFASHSGFQPIHIGGINPTTNLGGNADIKSLFGTGFNQYSYGAAGLPGNGLKTIDYGSNGYQLKTPILDATHFGKTETEEFKSDQNQASSHKPTDFSGFSEFKTAEITPPVKATSYSSINLNTAPHGSYGQGSVQNAFKFNQNIPQPFETDNSAANSYKSNSFAGNNNIVVGEGYSFKPSNLEIEAFKSLQHSFKTDEPISFKSNQFGSHGLKSNDYKIDSPKSNGYKFNNVKPYIPKGFNSNDLKPYVSKVHNHYKSNNVHQPKQMRDFGKFEYGKPQFSSHQFGNNLNSYKGYERSNQNSNKGFEENKQGFESNNHDIFNDFGGNIQNAYKGHENNNQNTNKGSEGKGTAEYGLNMDKHGSGMIAYVSVNNGNHGYTYSLRHP